MPSPQLNSVKVVLLAWPRSVCEAPPSHTVLALSGACQPAKTVHPGQQQLPLALTNKIDLGRTEVPVNKLVNYVL